MGSPSTADLKKAMLTNQIKNDPVTAEDVTLAERIYGPDLGTLKGKTTRRKPVPVVSDQVEVPPEIYSNNEDLVMSIDVMFVNGMMTMAKLPVNEQVTEELVIL